MNSFWHASIQTISDFFNFSNEATFLEKTTLKKKKKGLTFNLSTYFVSF